MSLCLPAKTSLGASPGHPAILPQNPGEDQLTRAARTALANASRNAGLANLAEVRVDGVSVGQVSSYTFSNATPDHTIAASLNARDGLHSPSIANPLEIPIFGTKSDYGTGDAPYCVAIGDLNGDGRLDLATANEESNTVSVLLGNGDGTFGPKSDYGAGSNPFSVAIGDLNGDGKPDLAVANAGSGTVSVLMGSGDGSFGPKTDYGTSWQARSVAIGDLNGDGNPDLAVANGYNNVSVFLGSGGGVFGARTDYGTDPYPCCVAIGDLNGDGKLDLAVANVGGNPPYTSTVSVLLGSGDGTFGPQSSYGAGSGPFCVALGDLSGDGKPDLSVANYWSNTVSVLLGNGDGTFGPKSDYGAGSNPTSVAVADLDGDGQPDLVATNGASNTASVFLGNGDGTFGPKDDYGTSVGPRSVGIGDLNGDGKPDLAVANVGSDSVSVLINIATTHTILASAGPHGSIDPFGPVVVLQGMDQTFTIAPDTCFHVADVLVDGGSIGPVTSYAFTNVQADHTIEARFERAIEPHILAVLDVPGDQGGKVHLLWCPSELDVPPRYAARSYTVWRRLTLAAAQEAMARGADLEAVTAALDTERPRIRVQRLGLESRYWEYVVSVPARGFDRYGYMAPTTADSVPGFIPWNVFMVDAVDSTGLVFYSSSPDSGYSVDNLSPPAPAPFLGAYVAGTTYLHWGESREPDFAVYRLYRGDQPDFVPGAGNLIATQADTGFADPGPVVRYYKLSAVDVHGNEGPYALLGPEQTIGVEGPEAATDLLLGPVVPNPTRGGAAIHLSLPHATRARLAIHDVAGRTVRLLVNGALPAGERTVAWDGRNAAGGLVASGLYFVRLETLERTRVLRMVVTE
jgi:hypothetical protein